MGSITIEIDRSKMSLGELSRRTGISHSHLSRVFSFQRRPSLETARIIADALNVSIDQFYEWWRRQKQLQIS